VGKNAAGVAAAAGRVNARQAEAQAARLAVAGAVVQAYLQLDHLYTRRDLAEQELRQRTRIADLVRQRVAAQLDSKAELRQAEIGVPSARGEIATLDEALEWAGAGCCRDDRAAAPGAGPATRRAGGHSRRAARAPAGAGGAALAGRSG
jgi:outer membrane protein TolC